MPLITDFVPQVMRLQGIGGPALIGESMEHVIALQLARRRPHGAERAMLERSGGSDQYPGSGRQGIILLERFASLATTRSASGYDSAPWQAILWYNGGR